MNVYVALPLFPMVSLLFSVLCLTSTHPVFPSTILPLSTLSLPGPAQDKFVRRLQLGTTKDVPLMQIRK